MLCITQEQYDEMKPLKFKIGESTYELTANGQIWPRAMNKTLGGQDGKIYLVVGDMGTDLGDLAFIGMCLFFECSISF